MITNLKATWYSIAKNEYRISINSIFPSLKPYFLPLLGLTILFYPTILAPMILDWLFDEELLNVFATFFTTLFNVMLLNIFIIFLTMPITLGVKDVKAGNMELLLSAPIKSSDVLLGEFFGKLPFYMMGAILMGGLFTGILAVTGTDMLIIIILTMLFVLNFLLAYWIGTVFGFYLKGKITKSAKMKDLGKALAFIIVIPVVFVMYGTMGIALNFAETNVLNFDMKVILDFFPSSWIGNISTQLAGMNSIADLNNFDFFLNSFLTFGLIIFTILGGKVVANRIYNLEPTSLSESVVKPHNLTYKFLKTIGGGGSFGTLLAYNFKNYLRKFENLSKLVYAVALMIMMQLFFNNTDIDAEFLYIISNVFSAILAGFVISEATMQGKEKLLIYRNTPLSDWKFILSKLILYMLIIIPITGIFNAFLFLTAPDLSLDLFVRNLLSVVLVSFAMIVFSLGLFLLNPPFNEKAPEFMINFQVIIMVAIMSFIGILILVRGFSFFEKQIIHILFVFIVGVLLLVFGKRRLTSLE
ncbi:MAG: hypothetical protein ACW981_07545 [Candidatus Hodarchaeales archaeon]